MMQAQQNKLYIDAGTVIVNLLKEEKSECLSLGRLDKLVNYIYEQLDKQGLVDTYQDIIFDVNFDAIERTVFYNNHLFSLIGDTILLKEEISGEIADKYKADLSVERIIKQFVKQRVA